MWLPSDCAGKETEVLANVKIEQDKENNHIHRVFVDGKQIDKITHLDFQIDPWEIPSVTLNIERMSGIDFEGQADVNFLNNPYTVQNACKILQEELMKHGDLYQGFCASIRSAINDMPEGLPKEVLPELIMRRIIGED